MSCSTWGHRLMIFRFPGKNTKIKAVAVARILDYLGGLVLPGIPSRGPVADSATVLAGSRRDVYQCLTRRADVLFELTDAVLCKDGPVHNLVDLTLTPEHRRGHGALYDGLHSGRLGIARVVLSGPPLPRTAGSCWRSMSVTG